MMFAVPAYATPSTTEITSKAHTLGKYAMYTPNSTPTKLTRMPTRSMRW